MKQGGFATLMALMLLGVVAAAMMALLGLLSIDARTTARDAETTQLRQLLLAGAADARQKLAGPDEPPDRWTVATPQELACQVQVEMTTAGDARKAVVTARGGSHFLSQTLHFRRAGGHWEAESAQYGD
jgi:hypothetical protein